MTVKGKTRLCYPPPCPFSTFDWRRHLVSVSLPLPVGGGFVTAAVSQCEAGAEAAKKTSLPCGGDTSLPSPGRLVLVVSGWGTVADCVESV